MSEDTGTDDEETGNEDREEPDESDGETGARGKSAFTGDGAAPEPNGQRADRRTVVPGHVMPGGPTRAEDEPARDQAGENGEGEPPAPGEAPRHGQGRRSGTP
jgi:hypothetical protein